MARSPVWRDQLRRHLAEHVNGETTLGAIFDAVADDMPLHTATRRWVIRNNYTSPSSPHRMKWHLMLSALHSADVSIADLRRKPLPRETAVSVRGSVCPICGNLFVRQFKTAQCSYVCGRRARVIAERGKVDVHMGGQPP
jgi:hypothetical protein